MDISKYNIMEAFSIRILFYMRKIIYTAMKGLSPVAAAMKGSLTLSYFNLFFIYSFLSVLLYWCPGNKYLIFLGKTFVNSFWLLLHVHLPLKDDEGRTESMEEKKGLGTKREGQLSWGAKNI